VRRLSELDIARPHIIDAVAASGIPIYIAVARGSDALFIEKTVLLNGAPVVVPITFVSATVNRTTIPLHACAPGKALLAYQTESFIQSVLRQPLKAFTSQTQIDKDALLEELKEIRQQGYALNRGEYAGHIAVGVPLLRYPGRAVAAIGSSGGPYDVDEEYFVRRSLPVLQGVGEKVSASLGHLNALSAVV
jgi:DNA-binding IclR family transcriptional regulator